MGTLTQKTISILKSDKNISVFTNDDFIGYSVWCKALEISRRIKELHHFLPCMESIYNYLGNDNEHQETESDFYRTE